jgi:hypothetical protein
MRGEERDVLAGVHGDEGPDSEVFKGVGCR